MSRGPGRIERRIAQLFQKDPRLVPTTTEICQYVYGVETVQKKHRVAVLRALKRFSKRSMPQLWREAQRYERSDIWFDHAIYPNPKASCAPASERRPRKL